MEDSSGIINMEWYYRKIVNYKDEIKMERKIKRELVFLLLLSIAFIIILFALFTSLWRSALKFDIYVASALGFNVLVVVLYLINDNLDPLKRLAKNDKVFVWIFYFLKVSKSRNLKKIWFHFILRIINSQLYQIKLKLNELFIFRKDLEKEYRRVEELIKLLSIKREYLLKNKDKLIEVFNIIVLLYGFKLSDGSIDSCNNLIQNDSFHNDELRLWEQFEKTTSEILSSRDQVEERKLFNPVVKFWAIIIVIMTSILFAGYYLFKYPDTSNKIVALISLLISILGLFKNFDISKK